MVLVDECVDRRLSRDLLGHDVKTARQMGWTAITNGELLALAAPELEVFVTVDRKLSFQQNLQKFDLAVILLVSKSNRLQDLLPSVPALINAIPVAERGKLATIGVANQ